MADVVVDHESGQTAIKALRFLAWLTLVGGIIGAVFILNQFGTRHSTTNPVAIAIAIGTVLQSALLCALLLVISYLSENVACLQKRFVNSDATSDTETLRQSSGPSENTKVDRSNVNPKVKWRCSKCQGPVRVNYGSMGEAMCKTCAEEAE